MKKIVKIVLSFLFMFTMCACGNKENGNGSTNIVKNYPMYETGAVIYYNPITNSKCDNYLDNNSYNGYKGEITETQNGCMKWYAFLDSSSSSKVKLILDHNTTPLIQWNTDDSNITYDESFYLQEEMNLLVRNNAWAEDLNIRIISAEEIAQIVGNNEFTTDSISVTFDNRTFDENTRNKYAWLYDRTYECGAMEYDDGVYDFGCNIEDNNIYNLKLYGEVANIAFNISGYWTSTTTQIDEQFNVWGVAKYGNMQLYPATVISLGLRPVIELNKTILN